MTRNKDLKRLVRARMRKTGEAYTTARANLLRRRAEPRRVAPRPVGPAALPEPSAYASVAGMSDQALKAATGCGWERWVRALDRHGAAKLPHAGIARLIRTKYKTPSWWTQTVAVGYERIRGLRVRGQRRDGTFNATRSRTFHVPVVTLYDAFADAATRKRWLGGAAVGIRTATKPKSIRFRWDDGRIVAVGFASKGPGKSSVAVEHPGLAGKDDATRVKADWSARFDALASVLAGP